MDFINLKPSFLSLSLKVFHSGHGGVPPARHASISMAAGGIYSLVFQFRFVYTRITYLIRP